MLTIFSTCRSFEDPIFNIIQRNAIQSWTLLKPTPQILLIGDDPGTAEICKEFDLEHIKNVRLSSEGTPLIDSMFMLAEKVSKYDILLHMASDMIVSNDTMIACEEINERFEEFCGGLRRNEVNVESLIDFTDLEWHDKLKKQSKLGHPAAGDYFLYNRGFWENKMPSFVIGRAGVDGWLYWFAKNKNCLVNLTKKVCGLHQSHEHQHFCESEDRKKWRRLSEFKINERLSKGKRIRIASANWEL